jgi:hypothetical protein
MKQEFYANRRIMKIRTNFDPPSDPYGDEVHCHICDACMVQDSTGEWECLEYHEEDLISQKDYFKKRICPACFSIRVKFYADEVDIDNPTVEGITINCSCLACKATWNELYAFSRYEMVGTK